MSFPISHSLNKNTLHQSETIRENIKHSSSRPNKKREDKIIIIIIIIILKE